jgi:hypothetical protein
MKTLRLVPVFGAPIEITKSVLVGRDATCDVVVPDGSISRRHARIEWRGENWAVVDQASANGTFLDSQRIAEAGLRHGQELRLGGVPFKVEIEGESEDLGATTISAPPAADATVIQPGPLPRPPAPVPPPPAAPPRPPAPAAPPAPTPRAAARPPAAPPLPAPPPPRSGAGTVPSITASLPPRPRISPPSPPPPPPPKQGRGPLFWVATGCVGCLGLVVLLGVIAAGGFYMMTRGPVEAVRIQLEEIKRGDLEGAYGRLSQATRTRLSREDFERLVAAQPALGQHTGQQLGFPHGVEIVNARAEVKGVLIAPGGAREEAVFTLVHEGGEWKIESIVIGGQPALDG